MKHIHRVLAALLALMLLFTLSGAVFASEEPAAAEEAQAEPAGEIVPELPQEEAPEKAAEEPIPAPADEPAGELTSDGAMKISGTVYASEIWEGNEETKEYEAISLAGDTTLIVDTDRKLQGIGSAGNYNLHITVQAGKTLTVSRAASGYSINTGGSLTVDGAGTFEAPQGLRIGGDVDLSPGELEIWKCSQEGIYSTGGSVTVNSSYVYIGALDAAIHAANGSVTIRTDDGTLTSERGAGIYAGQDITVIGSFDIDSYYSALRSVYGKVITQADITAKTSSVEENGNSYIISAGDVVSLRNHESGAAAAVTAVSAFGGVISGSKNIVVYCDTDITADMDSAFRADFGSVVIFSGDVSAAGCVRSTWPNGRSAGIYAGEDVHVVEGASLTASGSLMGVEAHKNVVLEGPADATATRVSYSGYAASAGIVGNTIQISAPLTASATDYALLAEESITIAEGLGILTPAGGGLGSDWVGYGTYQTVVDSAGSAAKEAVIGTPTGSGESDKITGLHIRGLKEPVVGETGDTSVNIAIGEAYTLAGVFWYEADSEGNPLTGDPLTGDWTFLPGRTYLCGIILQANEGRLFAEPEDFTSWVNGSTTEFAIFADRTMAEAYLLFTIPGTAPAGSPAISLASDGKTARAENFDGLYARVALILDNNGISGLYITQATINPGGEIVIPAFMMPGLTVKGVSVALVKTLADIQNTTPDVVVSDFLMY